MSVTGTPFDTMIQVSPFSALCAALHPLEIAPAGAAWNHAELSDLLPAATPVAAAVLVGLVPRGDALTVLLTRRTDSLRHHAGQVSFPGGRIEADDGDAIAAAVREAHEEIGLQPTLVSPLGYLDPLITITGFRVLPVVARVDPDFVAAPDPGEVAEVFEVDLDYLMHPDNLERIGMEYRGRQRHVLQYKAAPQAPRQRIWGATASILFNLRERIAATATR